MNKQAGVWQSVLRKMKDGNEFDDKFNPNTLEFNYAFQMGFKAAQQPIPVNQGVNLSELEKKFDEFFANETPETFWAFVEKKRQQEQPYWKQRCEAAEDVLDSLGINELFSTHRLKESPNFKEEIEHWQQLKSSPQK